MTATARSRCPRQKSTRFLRRAAARLYVSQPALSYALRKLEAEAGARKKGITIRAGRLPTGWRPSRRTTRSDARAAA
ncbi:LysR family transcriptional regulator [Streptomyces sp. NBRC 110028]|uniref:LysR family transcriptional regulator n=1 Tax=Streptomyces sp. NBRC 110028 TaxID=1621260 RepID=UPI00099EBD3A|nr:LysR family transcriptional regulator [Streptomyces sp. NBRC 110028]